MSPRQREATRIIAEGRFRPCLVREDDGWHARWRGESAAAGDLLRDVLRFDLFAAKRRM